MHECGVVESLLSAVDESVRGHRGTRAVRVVVSVSRLGGVQEGLLRDAFERCKPDSTARDAELVVEHGPADVACLDCGTRTQVTDGRDVHCPACGGGRLRPIEGSDIYLKSVEMEV